MFIPVAGSPEMVLPVLCEQYRRYCLSIRNVEADYVKKQDIYLKRLFDFLGPPRTALELFAKLDHKRIGAFLVDYAGTYGPGSRHNMHRTARVFLRFAYEEQFMAQDLSAFVPSVRSNTAAHIPKALPSSCITALEKSIDRSCPKGRRDAAIICLLSTYGVRGVQVRRLCLEDVDWKNERIHFPAAKAGRPIEQHLTAEAGNRLADYLVAGRPDSPHRELFLTLSSAAPIADSRHLSAMIHRRLKGANVLLPGGVSRGTHGFRHAFATRMTGKIPFKDVVDMLGHRNPSSTLVYAKVDFKTLQQAALPWPGA